MTRRQTFGTLLAAAFVAASMLCWLLWPLPADTLALGPAQSTRFVDRHGVPLREQLSALDTRVRPVQLDAVSPHVVTAILAAEDKRFFDHPGVDPLATARAAWQNLVELRVVSGGSTLTQQLARLLLTEKALLEGAQPESRSLLQKLREARLALRLERSFDKTTLLEAFLNRAPFGNLAVGIEAAAERYFAVSAGRLSLAQAAFLAGLPRGPTLYNPLRRFEAATRQQRRVLSAMARLGMITTGQQQRAQAEPIDAARHSVATRSVHAVDLAQSLLNDAGIAARGEVQLTLDGHLQSDVADILVREIPRVYARGGRSAAAVVLDTASGDILALVGAAFVDNPKWGEFNAATAVRQPGSALKPFIYAAALENGLTAATLAADIERPFPDTWGVYMPENYDGEHHGPVRLREALAQSLNVAAVDVLSRAGLQNAFDLLDRLGLNTLDRRPSYFGLGLTLGSGGVRLLDLTTAFSVLGRGGSFRPWHLVDSVTDDGQRQVRPRADERPVIDPRVAFIIGDMLSDANARVPQFGERSILRTPYWAAVKTGTSKGYRDNWTVGYTDRHTVGVWVGDPTGRPMQKMSGAVGAGRMWRKIINRVSGQQSHRPLPPSGLDRLRVCAVSGARLGPHCQGGIDEWFVAGTAPKHACRYHREVQVDPQNDLLVPPGCQLPGARYRVQTIYPSPFDAWAEDKEAGRSERVTPRCPTPIGPDPQVVLLSPAPTETLRLDGDAPRRAQALLLHAQVHDTVGNVSFLVDGTVVASVPPPHRAFWPVEPGQHAVIARLDDRPEEESAVHWVTVY